MTSVTNKSTMKINALPSGPTLPPVTHAGPENFALNRCWGETKPLSGTP
jgi:hypothetical protein